MNGHDEAAWLADVADTLAEVDQFLRTPAGHAALEDFYQARGSLPAGFVAANLIDAVSFTALLARNRAAAAARRS